MNPQAIYTKRLVLRPANNDEDLAAYKQLLEPSEYFFQFGYEYEEHLLDNYNFTDLGVICYSAFLKDTGEYIGYAGIMPADNEPEVGELEYFVSKAHRGKGYCHEAAAALIQSFKSGELTNSKGKTVFAEIVKENTASARVLKRLGFDLKHTGVVLQLVSDPDNPEGYKTAGKSVSTYTLDLCSWRPSFTAGNLRTSACEEQLLACA